MGTFPKRPIYCRPGQAGAAGRYDSTDYEHTWPVLDRVEILAMSEGTRAAAYQVLEDIRGSGYLLDVVSS